MTAAIVLRDIGLRLIGSFLCCAMIVTPKHRYDHVFLALLDELPEEFSRQKYRRRIRGLNHQSNICLGCICIKWYHVRQFAFGW